MQSRKILGTLLVLAVGCGRTGLRPDDERRPVPDAGPTPDGGECRNDLDCDPDGLVCNGASVCIDGVCQPADFFCFNEGECLEGICSETEEDHCEHVARDDWCPEGLLCDLESGECRGECTCTTDAECDDGLACNGTETCNGCTCVPGVGIECEEDDIDCTEVLCNDDTGECTVFPNHLRCPPDHLCDPLLGCVPIPCVSDAECDDAVFCNGRERCIGGECLPGLVPICDDLVSCTIDTCDRGTDRCRSTPNHPLCDDGLFCNGTEICDAARDCLDGPDPSCADALDCTIDSCDPMEDACVHEPPDVDRDGYGDADCGGDDCNDRDPTIHPGAPEVCDGVDQDCDASIDEGVLSECGDCRVGCTVLTFPDERAWDRDPGASNGVEIEDDGDLVLTSESDEVYFAWIANTNEGTVTKLDTRTGDEVARYPSAIDSPPNGSRPLFEACDPERGSGNCPSRTAVDLRGDVWVTNRAFGHQGTVTKIANFLSDCVDVDGDGGIETSHDANGNGRIDTADPMEFPGLDDECVLFTVDVGESNARADQGIPRAVAVDADGHPWVGLFAGRQALELDPNDGSVLSEIDVDVNPYGAAIDGAGILWLAGSCCGTGEIQSVDTGDGSVGDVVNVVSTNGCVGNYGIAIDTDDRVWLAGFPCEAAFRYTPESDRWFTVSLPGSGRGRGIAAATDGRIWMGSSHDADLEAIGRVTSFRAADGGGVRRYELPTGLGTIGVGLDADGNVWAISNATNNAARVNVGDGSVEEFPVGDQPYTYSDFTGYALRNITAPSGTHREIVEGCGAGPTEWEEITWDATSPPGTDIEVRVRSADTVVGLAAAPWMGPWDATPADLTSAPGPVPGRHWLEIEITLFSDGGAASPTLHSLSVQVNCP